MSKASILRARLLLGEAGTLVEGGGCLVVEGRIERVLSSPRAIARARGPSVVEHDLGSGLMAPGLVDAHVHLDLSFLEGQLSAERGFVPWVSALIAARARAEPGAVRSAAVRAAERLLATGTTTVGDIDASGIAPHLASRRMVRLRSYRELLDADLAERTASALATLARPWPRGPRFLRGLSPHAPYTTSDELLRAVASQAVDRRLPVAIHWAETAEEGEWLEHGRGPFAAVLSHSPRLPGLVRLERAGLLRPGTTLVHGNHPRAEEIERIAAAGCTLVHCPGSHRYFGRARFPLERYLEAGIPLALGTDSAASNAELDMRRELMLLASERPDLEPAILWRAATEGGARAVGMAGQVGRLQEGHWADVAVFATEARSHDELLGELTTGRPPVIETWVAGRRVWAA